MRSRIALITFLHYINPIPSDILGTFDSLEKLLLIEFNEAINVKVLTGSKSIKNSVIDYMMKLFEDTSMSGFVHDFFNNFVLKPSITVIKRLSWEK